MTAAPAPLVLRGLVRRFPGPDGRPFAAVDALDLEIARPGELLAVTGPDGAGKTTLLRLMAGILTPDAGEIRIFGLRPDTESRAFASAIGYMPQKTGLYEELTVFENFSLFGRLRGIPADRLADEFKELMTLSGLRGFEDRPAGKLSGGMKQKLGLSCALLGAPKLLILDEPTVGVDPLSRRELWRILDARRARTGMTVVFSTAYLDEAETADRVAVLARGRILAQGTPGALSAPLARRTFSARAPDPADTPALARALMEAASPEARKRLLADAVPRGSRVDLLAPAGVTPEDLRARAARAGLPPLALEPRAPGLEDLLADLGAGATEPSASADSAPVAPGDEDEARALFSPAADFEGADAVSARRLSRRFGAFTAVADTSFEVRRGEIFGLLGPNGAGKTTTFRMLCGLLEPSSGEIRAAGVDLLRAKSAARARVGYVAQKFSLYERLTARQNLEYFGEAYGVTGRELSRRIALLARELGLESDLGRRTAVLPLGAKRELAFACALVHRPAVLFLDEATSGADLAARRAFWRRIVRLARAGTTVVVTTHFMEEAEYCDRILIQDAGRVLASGTPLEIRERAGAASIDEAFRRIVTEARAQARAGTERRPGGAA